MFENIFKNSHEHPTEEEIRSGLEKKESNLKSEAAGFLEAVSPEKYKSKAASSLLAAMLSFGAISAFAGEQAADKVDLPDMTEETITQSLKKWG